MEAVHLVGAGGIGCAIGQTLLQAGVRVTLVDANLAKVSAGRARGVGVVGQSSLPAEFVLFDDWHPSPGVPVLLCVKCPANPAVLARLLPDTVLIPIQNGFDPVLDRLPPRVEGIASFVSECPPDQTITRITRPGDLHVGVNGTSSPTLRRVASALASRLVYAPFRVRVVEDIRPYKFTKLLYNAAISPLAAAAGLDNGALLRDRSLRRLFFALLRENLGILRSARIPLARIGPLHPAWVGRILARDWLANLLAGCFAPSLDGTYCSMAPDLRRSLPTEIDNYNGELVRLAGAFPCPLNRCVVQILEHMAAEKLPPHPDRLVPLLELVPGKHASLKLAVENQVG